MSEEAKEYSSEEIARRQQALERALAEDLVHQYNHGDALGPVEISEEAYKKALKTLQKLGNEP